MSDRSWESPLSKILGIKEFKFNDLGTYIYFLVKDNVVVYVGKTTNLISRYEAHKKREATRTMWVDGRIKKIESQLKEFDDFHYFHISERDLDEKEKYYIKRFLPKYNTCHVSIKARKEVAYEKKTILKFLKLNNLNYDIERKEGEWLIQANKREIDLKD